MTKDEFDHAVAAGVVAWQSRSALGISSSPEEHVHAILLAALTSLMESDLEYCPFDCDNCHGEDCPCDRGGCAGYVELL